MFYVALPKQNEAKLNWITEKIAIATFLIPYCKARYPDNPEYIERYTNFKKKYEDELREIVEEDKKLYGLSDLVEMIPDVHIMRYSVYNCPDYQKDHVMEVSKKISMDNGLVRRTEIEASSIADMANPIPESEIEDAKKRNDNRRLQNMTFQVTEECNLRCTYCYQINKSPQKMTFEVAKKMVDRLTNEKYLERRKNMFGYILEFIGGEPFLMVDLIDQILDYYYDICIKKDLRLAYHTRISICSNGTLYFTDEVQSFIKKWRNVMSFGISIDGHKELHDACRVFPDGSGSFDVAMKACHHYQMFYGKLPGSKMTIAHSNIPYITQAVSAMMDEGYDSINLNCVYEDGWADDDPNKLYYQLKGLADVLIDNDRCLSYWMSIFKYEEFSPLDKVEETQNYCGGNGAMIAVDYEGKIFPCIRLMKSSLGNKVEPLQIGDIETGIANKKEYKDKYDYMLSITRQSQSDEKCMNCLIGKGCGWCSGYNYQKTGDINKRVTYICKMHQARALANGYMWNKFFLKEDLPYFFHNYIPKEWALEIIPEEEYEMILDLEREIIYSERNRGREVTLTNYGNLDSKNPIEAWLDIVKSEEDLKRIH